MYIYTVILINAAYIYIYMYIYICIYVYIAARIDLTISLGYNPMIFQLLGGLSYNPLPTHLLPDQRAQS